jgi:hypothetical protein
MSMKKMHGGRALLNGPGHHSTGAIAVEVEDTSLWSDKKIAKASNVWDHQPRYVFQFSDCGRTISFELDWTTKEDRENTLRKIDLMIDNLQEFRAGVELEQKRFVARQKQIKKRRKKEKAND